MAHSSWVHFLAQAAVLVPAFLVSVSFHEFSHALVAYLLGDSTAKEKGRLTLNPFAHVDPMGLLFLVLFRVGWANPVPMDQSRFKHPRLYAVLTAFAGPLSNFLLAFFCLLCIKYLPTHLMSAAVSVTFLQIFQATASVNIMLGVFNILPIPPLDGSHVLIALLINRFPRFIQILYRYSLFILLFIFMLPPTRKFLAFLIMHVEQIIKSLVF